MLLLLENLLRSMKQSSTYQLIPESIMTGFCWRTDDGTSEGIFKDVNSGLSQWRERQSIVSAGHVATDAVTASISDNEYLSDELKRMSFEATDFAITKQTAKITGILTTASDKRQLVLDIALPDAGMPGTRQDIIALKAITEISTDTFNRKRVVVRDQPVKLCLTMQAARNINIPDPSSGKPLLLSHYY